ncbi:MAG TPA: helix-turn-helix transcriptional regulator [Stellaceae bacterium]|jgi:transcriptional regulator with XRE-family HTH domain|nr:helix-turn-helix transcriptional regulator [Stellaceae bacterium]
MNVLRAGDRDSTGTPEGTRRRRTAKLDGPHPIDVHVGARIRHRRAVVGLNQTELALKVGVTFQSIQKYERGTNRVSASRLQEIAHVLGVPVSHFFEGLDSGVAAPAVTTATDALTSQEIRDLNNAYAAISDKALRQAVLHLLRSVAESPGSAAALLPTAR